ncbi:MAG: DNA replication/repair protein RecF [Gemmatimonadales bacterium]
MRAARLEAHDFRNLASLDLELPAEGAVFLGPNGQGKTNLLEAMYYPVLFRSLRGARDADLVRHQSPGFFVRLEVEAAPGAARIVEAGFAAAGRRKRISVDGAESTRMNDALGVWLAVAFLPADVTLISGAASLRRHFLDRTLSLADGQYLRALRHYRAGLEQRNAALRQGISAAAWAFDPGLARHGAVLVERRRAWVARYGGHWAATCAALGEPMPVRLELTGPAELAEPAGFLEALERHRPRDLNARATGVGPHRDDLELTLDATPLRIAGSTGQQRTAAIALKLCERDTLAAASGRTPALLLDDVFAELDRDRQERLAARLELRPADDVTPPQVFVTAPRVDELPPGLNLPVHRVNAGLVEPANGPARLSR